MRNFLIILIALLIFPTLPVEADLIDDLKKRIEEQNKKIEKINEEIQTYQKEVQKVGAEKQSLQSAVRTLDLSQERLEKDIDATEGRIYSASLTIEKLELEIDSLEEDISENKEALADTIRNINENDDQSTIEVLLAHETITEAWDKVESLNRFKDSLREHVSELENFKESLHDKVAENVSTKVSLEGYKEELGDKKEVVEYNKQEKEVLLERTKNKEAEYNRLIQEKVAQRKAFEQALFDLESQLNIAIDPTKLPPAGKGVLRWPLDSVVITQYFGRTSSSGRLYASGTHNGVDFGTAVGTPVKSAASGTVWATGNTDNGRCLSYGKWVLVKHNNGLSTLYAHLSLIKSTKGQVVNPGDVIGYSGNTGYSTGPHLHFTVYATEGVRIQQYTNSINCGDVVIPIADPKAYLDPMIYL